MTTYIDSTELELLVVPEVVCDIRVVLLESCRELVVEEAVTERVIAVTLDVTTLEEVGNDVAIRLEADPLKLDVELRLELEVGAVLVVDDRSWLAEAHEDQEVTTLEDINLESPAPVLVLIYDVVVILLEAEIEVDVTEVVETDEVEVSAVSDADDDALEVWSLDVEAVVVEAIVVVEALVEDAEDEACGFEVVDWTVLGSPR